MLFCWWRRACWDDLGGLCDGFEAKSAEALCWWVPDPSLVLKLRFGDLKMNLAGSSLRLKGIAEHFLELVNGFQS